MCIYAHLRLRAGMAIQFDDWQDVKVAYEVARLGTLTAAADLGALIT